MPAWLTILLVVLILVICITPVVIDEIVARRKYKDKLDVDKLLNRRNKK